MKYGDVSRAHRRLFHQFLNTNEAKRLEGFQYLSIHEFLHQLVEDPNGFFGHTKLCVALMIRLVCNHRFNAHHNSA